MFLLRGVGPPLEAWTSPGAQSPAVELNLAYATLTQEEQDSQRPRGGSEWPPARPISLETRTRPGRPAGTGGRVGPSTGLSGVPRSQDQVTLFTLGCRPLVRGAAPLLSPLRTPRASVGRPTSCPLPPLIPHTPTALGQGHQRPPCHQVQRSLPCPHLPAPQPLSCHSWPASHTSPMREHRSRTPRAICSH